MNDDETAALVRQLRAKRVLEAEAADIECYVIKLEAGVLKLADSLIAQQAHAAGFEAVINAFLSTHPDSELLEPVGEFVDRDISRKIKCRWDLIYEVAFDEAARAREVANPRILREG